MGRILAPVSLALLAAACNESHSGRYDAGEEVDSAVHCEPCEDAVQLRIAGVSDPSLITVEGAEVSCSDAGAFVYCGIRTLPPGEYSLTIRAPGMIPETVFFDLGEPITVDGCTCPMVFSRLIRLRPM